MQDAAFDVRMNLNLLVLHDPKMGAAFCASVLSHPELGALKDEAQGAARTAWKEMLKNDPEGAKDYAKIQLYVYGDKPAVADVIKSFPELASLPPLAGSEPSGEKPAAEKPRPAARAQGQTLS